MNRASVRDVQVDTVGVAFPSSGLRRSSENFERRTHRIPLAGGGFVATGVNGYAWVEASLPKRCRGENVDGLSLDDFDRAVGEMVAEACQVVLPAPPVVTDADGSGNVTVSVENPRLVRLDLVRDFHLTDPKILTPILNGLAEVPRSGGVKVRRFNDGRTGAAETLRVGPGAWAATLYDKCAETRGLAPQGSLRAEFRLRGRQLVSQRAQRINAKIVCVNDVTVERAEALRRFWFDHVGFHSWVGGSRSLWPALADIGLSDREKIYFAGWLQAREAGVVLHVSEPTDRRCRRILARLQLGNNSPTRVRLDYESGHEVVEELA